MDPRAAAAAAHANGTIVILAAILLLLTTVTCAAAAVYRADEVAASVAFVTVSFGALLLRSLRAWDGDGNIKTAVLITSLRALAAMMFAYTAASSATVAPLLAVALVVVFLCLRVRGLERALQIGLGGHYAEAELLKMGFGAVACDSALAYHHHARGDAGSLAFVLVAYVGFLTLAWLFLRRFDGRARGAVWQ